MLHKYYLLSDFIIINAQLLKKYTFKKKICIEH